MEPPFGADVNQGNRNRLVEEFGLSNVVDYTGPLLA